MSPKKLNPINDLILFVLYSLYSHSPPTKCSFEKLTEKCFKTFPEVFALKGFNRWPDSRKLDRPLRDLRNKKLIKGDPKSSFTLTELGKKKAAEIAKTFTQKRLL